jgi:hypothetical protein
MRGSSPAAQCLTTWATPEPAKETAAPVAEETAAPTAAPVAEAETPILQASAFGTFALAALALYA